jgi:hypothetical protein
LSGHCASSDAVYVALSVAINESSRNEDYFDVSLITALNWKFKGFCPVLFIISRGHLSLRSLKIIKSIQNFGILFKIIFVNHSAIYVSQHCRLSASHHLNVDNIFLRITDADMLINEPSAFSSKSGIHSFNGRCCQSNNQFPMHSVGMNISLWRNSFAPHLCETPSKEVLLIHGQSGWDSDQVYLTQQITSITQSKQISLSVDPDATCRMHVGDTVNSKCLPIDIHLANYNANHWKWLRNLLYTLHLVNASDIQVIQSVLYPDLSS